VPRDPCNSEPLAHWTNCAYWGEEKRPDIWRYAVDNESGEYIAWQVKGDAAKYGFHINHTPQVGDLAAWPPNATMGTEKSGNRTIVHIASAGGHLAYVQHVHGQRIAISTTGIDSHGGYTFTIKYNQRRTFFIHRGRSAT
jgi:surface antigen